MTYYGYGVLRHSKNLFSFLLLFGLLLFTAEISYAQSVSDYTPKSTDFTEKTILKAQLADNHFLTIRCLISKGKAREFADEYSDIIEEIPAVGTGLKFARKLFQFKENDAVCTLIQTQAESVLSAPTQSRAKIYIRTWKDEEVIREESAWVACRVSSFCFEIVKEDGDIDGLSACVETTTPETKEPASFILSVNTVPEGVAASASQNSSYEASLCRDRTY